MGSHVFGRVRQGFTIIELLVVIAIIGILAGVLFASFSGGSESARSARCMSNMRNLATACQSYGAEHGRYPHAGSIEYMTIDESDGISQAKAIYAEEPGWIGWASKDVYRKRPTSHQASASWMISMYSDDDEMNFHCMTNGVLWKYVSGSRQTYVCPAHAKKMSQTPPLWSYLMNAYFGWDTSRGSEAESSSFYHIEYGRLNRADRVLLFCEVPFTGEVGSWKPEGTGPSMDCDCVLQYNTAVSTKSGNAGDSDSSGSENIGFNHKTGKMTFANVVFADGHVEKLVLPKNGMSDGELRNLTAWLCSGVDVSFDGKRYQKIDN